ncbi:MAG: 30S ribosomal protein S17e [Nanoarchaeota archaeon]|nr:30S ribosomal protein S17e [Nanoarchaeota archaeon]MBU1135311.1 30S ribosomal protein S17e [Nanoarchaeota archaeon]MBU2520037.1 30S ribosomal protein S17e [Nanoarchaeota archaeon]
MGRIKTTPVKTLGDELIKAHPKSFSEDFDKNKQALGEVKKIKSKKIRNVVAGYITKKMQKIKKSGI